MQLGKEADQSVNAILIKMEPETFNMNAPEQSDRMPVDITVQDLDFDKRFKSDSGHLQTEISKISKLQNRVCLSSNLDSAETRPMVSKLQTGHLALKKKKKKVPLKQRIPPTFAIPLRKEPGNLKSPKVLQTQLHENDRLLIKEFMSITNTVVNVSRQRFELAEKQIQYLQQSQTKLEGLVMSLINDVNGLRQQQFANNQFNQYHGIMPILKYEA